MAVLAAPAALVVGLTPAPVVSPTSLTFVVPPTDANGGSSWGKLRDLQITNGAGTVSTATPAGADDWTWN